MPVETLSMTTKPPLSGVRVLDFGQVLAAPYATMVLADQGAEVIKIEPLTGEPTRGYVPPNVGGQSPYFLTVNRNKRGVALNLKTEAGLDAVMALVKKSDVIVENFRAGVMDQLGIGYAAMKALNPMIIYCAISGYGRTGPFADRAGYDPIAQAESGLMAISGEPDGMPTRCGVSIVDSMAGLSAAQAISSALYARGSRAEGQLIEVSLFGTALNMLVNFAGQSLLVGDDPRRFGSGSQVAQPSGLYATEDGEVMITVGSEGMYRRFCEKVLNRSDLVNDPRFATNSERIKNKVEMDAELVPIFSAMKNKEALARMHAATIPCGEVLGVRDALSSPMADALNLVGSAPHTELGELKTLLPGYSFSETKARDPRGAPLLGEHTRSVLKEIAGYDDRRVDLMIAEGAAFE